MTVLVEKTDKSLGTIGDMIDRIRLSDWKPPSSRPTEGNAQPPQTQYTPLNTPKEDILHSLSSGEMANIIKWPQKMRNPRKGGKNEHKYCAFHEDRGHTTEECYDLKNAIEDMIRRGYLRKYVKEEATRWTEQDRQQSSPPER